MDQPTDFGEQEPPPVFECKEIVFSEKKLTAHIAKHTRNGKRECKTCVICKKIFRTRDSFVLHSVRYHSQEEKNSITVCGICAFPFNKIGDLITHFEKEHPNEKLSVLKQSIKEESSDTLGSDSSNASQASANSTIFPPRIILTSNSRSQIYMPVFASHQNTFAQNLNISSTSSGGSSEVDESSLNGSSDQ